MSITLNQHRAGMTQALVATFKDNVAPKEGLAAFFPMKTSRTKAISIEVERHGRKIAVDVARCTDPIRNVFSKSTEKIFVPPYFHESFDFTACQRYDVTFGTGNAPGEIDATMLMQDAMGRVVDLKNKVIRAIELQRSQVLQTGVVVLKNGDNVDYNRKAGSMVVKTVAGEKWTVPATADPVKDLRLGCEFIRTEGKSGGNVFNAILGQSALINFLANAKVQAEADIKNISRVSLNMPQFDNVTGLVLHGQVSAGEFIVNLWSYNESYDHPTTGVDTKYITADNVILLPDDFKGFTMHAAVDAVMGDAKTGQYIAPVEAEFLVYDVIDQVKRSWNFMLDSAPLVVPVSVDRIYTLQTTS